MSNSDLYRATSAILNGEIIKPSSIQTVYAPADPAKYNAGFIISLIFIPQMVQAMGIQLTIVSQTIHAMY